MSSPAPDVAHPATPPDLEAFVARHWAFAQRLIAAKVRWVRDADRDDTRSDGLLALWEAARTFDPAKGGKEEAHVLHTISWRLIDHHRDRYGRAGRPGHHGPPLPLDDDLTRVLADPHDSHAGSLDALAVRQILAALEPQHRDVLSAYFLDGRQLADIGKEQGVSESRISKKVKAALATARQVSEGQPATATRRPVTIACQACGTAVPVKATGRMPRYCMPSHAPRRTKHAPRPALVAGRGAFVRSRGRQHHGRHGRRVRRGTARPVRQGPPGRLLRGRRRRTRPAGHGRAVGAWRGARPLSLPAGPHLRHAAEGVAAADVMSGGSVR